MKLPTRYLVTGAFVRMAVLGILGLVSTLDEFLLLITLPSTALYFRYAAWLNKKAFFPILVRYVRCYHCKHLISLTQYWGTAGGDHRDHRCQYVTRYHDTQGREISSFPCPRSDCAIKPTIQVQKAIDGKVVRGQILGNAATIAAPDTPASWLQGIARVIGGAESKPGMPLGISRTTHLTRRQRFVRRLLGQPLYDPITINEEGYGLSMNIFGRSGKGKSKLMVSIAKWIADAGHGATFIDPHGDLIADILRVIPEDRRDDVLLIRVKDATFQMNVLEAFGEDEEVTLVEDMMHMIKKISDSWGPNIGDDLEDAIRTIRKVGGSLEDVYDVLTKPTARERIMRQLDPVEDEVLINFWQGFKARRASAQTPVSNKLRSIVKHPLLGPMLCAMNSDFNPDEIIVKRKIVLVDLSTGSLSDRVNVLFGTVLFTKIVAAAFRQLLKKESDRVRHFMFLDEASSFTHKGMDWSKIYSQARKVKFSLGLVTQTVSQLPSTLQDEVFGNAGLLISFGVKPEDGKLLSLRIPNTTYTDFSEQKKGECIACVNETLVYRVKTQLPAPANKNQTDYIKKRMLKMNAGRSDSNIAGESKRLGRMAPSPILQVCEGVQ